MVGPPSAPPPSMDHKSGPVGCLELTLDGAILTEAVTAPCRKRDMAPPTTQVVPTSKLLDEDDFVELYHRVESTTIAWVHIHLGETNRSDAPGPEVVGDRIAAVAEHQVREGRHFTILGTVKRPEWEAKGFKRLRKATGVQHYVADESSTKRKTCGAPASLGRPQAASTLGPTGWRWQLLEAILIHAGDPDVDVARWLDGHTPLGIKSEIVPRGIFPRTEQTAAQLASWEFYRGRISEDIEENYASYKENAQESAGELSRLIREGHVEPIGTWADVKARWPDALATKLATIVNARTDGTTKVRFVVDMRRSGINGLSKCRERITLPRGEDVVNDVLRLLAHQGTGGRVELLTVDIPTTRIAESPSVATAPLLWGRLAAAISRYAQACHWSTHHRLQTYMFTTRSSSAQEAKKSVPSNWPSPYSGGPVYVGVRMALHKLHRGQTVPWIGVEFNILPSGLQISFDKTRTTKLLHTIEEMLNHKGLIMGLRSLTGELAWMAGFVPRARPWVTMLWAALTEADRAQAHGGRHKRPAGSVLRPMVVKPLTWLKAFLRGHTGRPRPAVYHPPTKVPLSDYPH